MYCPVCGTENVENAAFCNNCGQNLNAVDTVRATRPVAPVKSPNTGIKIVGWGGAIFMPIIGIIAAIILMFKDEAAHGLAMLAVSIFMMFAWMGM